MWSWVEVDGAGWRWVYGLAIPLKKKFNFILSMMFTYAVKLTNLNE